MRTNEAFWDRALRLICGTALVTCAVTGPQVWWGWFGVLQIATGLSGHCVLYRLFRVDTTRWFKGRDLHRACCGPVPTPPGT